MPSFANSQRVCLCSTAKIGQQLPFCLSKQSPSVLQDENIVTVIVDRIKNVTLAPIILSPRGGNSCPRPLSLTRQGLSARNNCVTGERHLSGLGGRQRTNVSVRAMSRRSRSSSDLDARGLIFRSFNDCCPASALRAAPPQPGHLRTLAHAMALTFEWPLNIRQRLSMRIWLG